MLPGCDSAGLGFRQDIQKALPWRRGVQVSSLAHTTRCRGDNPTVSLLLTLTDWQLSAWSVGSGGDLSVAWGRRDTGVSAYVSHVSSLPG